MPTLQEIAEATTKNVYVPYKGTHDYTKAWDFGQLIFCTTAELSRTDIATMHSELSLAMENAEEDDFILLTSLTSLCSIACAIFARRFGRLNLLLFERGKYIERYITLD